MKERRATRRRGPRASRKSASSCCCCTCSSANLRDSTCTRLETALWQLSLFAGESVVDGGELCDKNQFVRRPGPFCRANRSSATARGRQHRRLRQQRRTAGGSTLAVDKKGHRKIGFARKSGKGPSWRGDENGSRATLTFCVNEVSAPRYTGTSSRWVAGGYKVL